MKTRDAVLKYQETQTSDASTDDLKLDIVDPVSALCFEFQAQNGTTNNRNNPLSRCITKLEVVNGSDVLASMSFEQAQALQWYKTGKQPMLREDEDASSYDVIGCMIMFGRHLWDREYAMDFTRFKNPKLKITWDLAAIRAVAADTAWATGTFKISVAAKVMEGLASPGKYLMAKQVDSWTGGSSGDKRVDLPLDYIYRMLMLRTYYSGNDIDENITNVKLTCDTDKYIPLDRHTKPLDAELAQLFGSCKLWKRASFKHSDTVWVPVNKEPQVKFNVPATDRIASYAWCWSGNFYGYLTDLSASTVGTAQRVDLMIEGHALHNTLPLPMGVMDDPSTWFDPTEYKKLELVLTEAAGAANSVVAEQVRPLP